MKRHSIVRATALSAALFLAACAATPAPDPGTVPQERQKPPVAADAVTPPPQPQPYPLPPPPPAPPPPPMEMRAQARAIFMPPPMPGASPENGDQYEEVATNPIHVVAEEPISTFSLDVDTASYSNVRRFLNDGQLPPADAVRVEELINYFDYDYPLPATRAQPFAPSVTVAPSPWAEGRLLVHIGLQGFDIIPAERPPLNLVLLLDVSGSMNEPSKLPLAVQGFRALVEELGPRDRVSIVVYAGAAGAVLEPTPGNDRAAINAALDRLSAGGSTAGGQGLALAYALARQNFSQGAVNRIILATDGDFNVGETNNERLEDFVSRQRESGVYLSVLGFGRGNYNDALMQTLAQNGNGNAAYIDTLAEARRVLADDLSRNLFPIANDVKLQVEFNPARVAEYRLIGYETRMLNREDFTNDRVDAGDVGAGASVTAIYEITPVGGPTFNEPLRYQSAPPPRPAGASSEFGFLRIRYKLPGETESREIVRPITQSDAVTRLSSASQSTRFAVAVAGFGQLLRGDRYLQADYGYDDVLELAQGARGTDTFGWRAEFVQLVRAAQAARTTSPELTPPPVPRPR